MKNTICIIIPFFGNWPKHFKLFLKSCSYNTEVIDYLFLTDITPPSDYPKNVRFQSFNLTAFNALASSKLGIDINISSPYKLCDFKPAYGALFSDFLTDYQYWGHGDEDLILGDLSVFLKNIKNQDIDVFSVRKEWLSGSFCLYKNTNYVNSLFKESISYPHFFTTDKHMSFGECFKQWDRIVKGENILDFDDKQSMTFLVKKAHSEGKLNIHFETKIKESIPEGSHILFNKGKVYLNDSKEFLAYHYVTEKKSPSFTYPNWETIPDKFYVDKTGFFTDEEWNNETLKKEIRSTRKRQGQIKELKNVYKRVVKKLFS